MPRAVTPTKGRLFRLVPHRAPHPAPDDQPKPENHGRAPPAPRPRHDVAALELHEPPPRLHLAHRADRRAAFLDGPEVAAQQLRRLRTPQRRRRVGPGDLEYETGAVSHERRSAVRQPGPTRLLG